MSYDHKVLEIRNYGNGNYILKLERNNINFNAGQFFSIGIPSILINREYSVCSGENDDYLEFLIREISDGILSKELKNLVKGSKVKVLGPYGNFYLKEMDLKKKYIFIASGTGISPFMSLIKTYPNLNYNIYHGIRYYDDGIQELDNLSYLRFITREKVEKENCFNGRVTNYFNFINKEDKDSYAFLCGNSLMVTEIYDKLMKNNFKSENIFTEIFF